MSESKAFEERNAYLELRQAKIARNHARLHELGLISRNLGKWVAPENTVANATAKRAKSNTSKTIEPQRRSLRMRKVMVDPIDQPPSKPIAVEQLIEQKDLESTKRKDVETTNNQKKTSTFAKNSAREMELDVERLLFGSTNEDGISGMLGIQLLSTGKAFVIEESARRAVDKEVSNPISFNKYCGAQEWSNAIYLWINFGFPGSEVVNTFDLKGRQVNWFGGSKMHDGSPLIQRLKDIGVEASRHQPKDSDRAVILWCRHYNVSEKGFDPYVCFGRLSVSFFSSIKSLHLILSLNPFLVLQLQSYDPTSRPVVFQWNLIDFDKILHHESKQVRETFQKFVECTLSD